MQYQRRRKVVPRARPLQALPLLFLLWAQAGPAADFAVDPLPLLELQDPRADQLPAHRLQFSILAGELETYTVVIEYPEGFEFQGLHRLGPANTLIGTLDLHLNDDGVAERSIDIRSVGAHDAYVDLIPDGILNPGLEPRIQFGQNRWISVHLPMGGDARLSTILSPIDAVATINLAAGLFLNPQTSGSYTVRAELTSVDPDTGGFDDGLDPAPQSITLSTPVEILPAGPTTFSHMHILRSVVRSGRPGRDHFYIKGTFAIGADSDGLNLADEDVSVTFGPFSESIPGSALRHSNTSFIYTNRAGIRLLEIKDDGSFVIATRSLDLGALDHSTAVRFELRIGNDVGEVEIPFSRSGLYPR